MTKRLILMTAMASVLPEGLSAQRQCEFRDDVELRGTAAGNLQVDAGAGRLTITGSEGTGVIHVSATLCASDQRRLDGLDVALDGDRLSTDYPNRNGGWGRNYARIDLAIEVPPGTNVHVEDSSGSLEISGVGDVELRDGSGSVSLADVGSVYVEDGSGSVRIEDADGDVEVRDGSGSLAIQRVAGAVVIEDGSGSLAIQRVAGAVMIEDASGSIRIAAVSGSVHIDEFSGGVEVRDVEGDLVVTGGRREQIRYSDIRGTVDLPSARRGRGS